MIHKIPRKKLIGFTCGAFDLCHAGHFLMFKEAKEECDYLIVGLQTDPSMDRPEKNKPVMSLDERLEILSGIKYIDEIVIYDTEKDLYQYLQENQKKIDLRFVGADWKGKAFTGYDLPVELVVELACKSGVAIGVAVAVRLLVGLRCKLEAAGTV